MRKLSDMNLRWSHGDLLFNQPVQERLKLIQRDMLEIVNANARFQSGNHYKVSLADRKMLEAMTTQLLSAVREFQLDPKKVTGIPELLALVEETAKLFMQLYGVDTKQPITKPPVGTTAAKIIRDSLSQALRRSQETERIKALTIDEIIQNAVNGGTPGQ